LGRLIRTCRQEVVITTKVYFPTGTGINDGGSSRYHIMNAVEASLKRLGTDRIDIYFLHRFDEITPLEETLHALDDLVRQGKILYIGASNFSAWQTAKALCISAKEKINGFCCLQPMYNLVKRQAEVEILPLALEENLGVIPYSPLGGGLLSGKYSSSQHPDKGRLIDNQMYKTRYSYPWMFEAAERFTALAKSKSIHPASLAVAWVASHPAVTAPIIGARNTEQLKPLLEAPDIDMTPELRREISLLSPELPSPTDRNEENAPFNYGIRE